MRGQRGLISGWTRSSRSNGNAVIWLLRRLPAVRKQLVCVLGSPSTVTSLFYIAFTLHGNNIARCLFHTAAHLSVFGHVGNEKLQSCVAWPQIWLFNSTLMSGAHAAVAQRQNLLTTGSKVPRSDCTMKCYCLDCLTIRLLVVGRLGCFLFRCYALQH